jgi:beta-xylosidase
MIHATHNYTHDDMSTMAAALNQGGVDVNCGGSPAFYAKHACDAVETGAVKQSDVDRAARRYWRTMMRLGMFDSMEEQPMVTSIGAAHVDSAATRELAQRTAAESLVLLKNADGGTHGFLPLDGKGGRGSASGLQPQQPKLKLAFVGPHANSTQDLLSAPQYHGQNTLVDTHSPLQVAWRRGWDVTYAKGVNICDWQPQGYPNQPCSRGKDGSDPSPLPPPDTSGIAAAVAAAKAADVAVLFLGADQVGVHRGGRLVGAQPIDCSSSAKHDTRATI